MENENRDRGAVSRLLLRIEGRVNTLLAFLSMLAIALVVSSELVSPGWTMPYLHIGWPQIQWVARFFIWSVFVIEFGVYALISKRPFTYARTHLAELIICVAWVPHYSHGDLGHIFQLITLSGMVPLDVLQLVGTLAHSVRVLRFTRQRFSDHPVIVVGAAALLLIGSTAALLNHFEPQTFTTFWDGCWFALTTITTVGFGDLYPHTPTGKMITAVFILLGVSLGGVFLGLMSTLVRSKLVLNETTLNDVQEELIATKAMVEELKKERQTTNELLRQLLDKHEQNPPSPPPAAPVHLAPHPIAVAPDTTPPDPLAVAPLGTAAPAAALSEPGSQPEDEG